jgi:hypothetical protein
VTCRSLCVYGCWFRSFHGHRTTWDIPTLGDQLEKVLKISAWVLHKQLTPSYNSYIPIEEIRSPRSNSAKRPRPKSRRKYTASAVVLTGTPYKKSLNKPHIFGTSGAKPKRQTLYARSCGSQKQKSSDARENCCFACVETYDAVWIECGWRKQLFTWRLVEVCVVVDVHHVSILTIFSPLFYSIYSPFAQYGLWPINRWDIFLWQV